MREEPSPRPSLATAVCLALKAEGIGIVSPGHPRLASLIAAGAEVQTFVDAARSAKAKDKASFAYVLGTVEGQMADAKTLAAASRTAPRRNGQGHSGSTARAARMAEAVPNLVASHGDFIDTEARDVTARRLG